MILSNLKDGNSRIFRVKAFGVCFFLYALLLLEAKLVCLSIASSCSLQHAGPLLVHLLAVFSQIADGKFLLWFLFSQNKMIHYLYDNHKDLRNHKDASGFLITLPIPATTSTDSNLDWFNSFSLASLR